DVRGTDPSLGHAVRTRGWPTLGAVRGRVLFALDNEGFASVELQGHPSLRGRILFAPSSPGTDDAAFAKLNDPIHYATKIKAKLALADANRQAHRAVSDDSSEIVRRASDGAATGEATS